MKSLVRLSDDQFRAENCSRNNGLYLWKNISDPPFVAVVGGWQIVGIGTAPWPDGDNTTAVLFERVDPPTERFGNLTGDDCEVGTRMWQHGREEWVPGSAKYERRMIKTNKTVQRRETAEEKT